MVIKVREFLHAPHKKKFQNQSTFWQLKVFHASLLKQCSGHHDSGKAEVLNTEGSIRTTCVLDLILPYSPSKYFPKLFVATTNLHK